MRKGYVFLVLLVLSLVACTDSQKSKTTSISGEILNPKESYLVISKDDQFSDTVSLDENHHFHYQFKTVEKGFYTLQHSYETQKFYIQKGDSLQVYLNTREFDESMMYSGSGAVANNFLMDLFLDNEKNNKIFLSYYKYDPKEFSHKTDSIKAEHFDQLNKLNDKWNFSTDFKTLAQAIIDYAHDDLRERYFFLVNKYNQKLKKDLPSDFLAYRKTANYNDKELETYYIYQHFLDNYLKNKSIEYCQNHHGHKNCFDLKTKENLDQRLQLSDSLFKLKGLRTRFLSRFASESIIYSTTGAAVDSVLAFLNNAKYNDKNFEIIKRLAHVQKTAFIGNIGSRQLLTPAEKNVTLASVLRKPTVLFYWSLYYPAHQKNAHKKIQTLRKRYPEVDFIGMNINFGDFDLWQTSLENFHYDQKFEYQIRCKPKNKILYQNYLNKLVFVNKKGKILEGNLDLQDRKLENEILELLNR